MRHLIALFILACTAGPAFAGNITSSWFAPFLIENNDPACKELLQDANKKFLSHSSFHKAYGITGYGYSQTGTILDWDIIGGTSLREIKAFGKTYYLERLNHKGCGGACETNQPLISDKPFPEPRNYSHLMALAGTAPPAVSYNYTIARASADNVYLFAVGSTEGYKNRIFIYSLAHDGHWAPACKISTAPQNPHQNVSKKLVNTLKSLQEVVNGGLMRGAGNCGSMKTHWRWKTSVRDALQKVLYRPWTLRESNSGADVDGSYNNDIKYLEQWSLFGLYEYTAFKNFQVLLHEATDQLAAFLHTANGWPLETSKAMAAEALKGAVSRGIRFYMYNPGFSDGEEAIRRAILEQLPIKKVQSIPFDSEGIDDKPSRRDGPPETRESILSVAIKHPEALKFLLNKGINPEHVNGFGKTPLMYAAQHNQLESAKLLIKHGANVNAATVKPSDNCYYTISTYNMTPLHYAVRYASPELIRLLLDNGAQTFINAKNRRSHSNNRKSPLDWLHLYTGTDTKEKNPNIPDAQVSKIERWLTPIKPDDATKKATDYVLNAEAAYHNGNMVKAYRYASLAIQLQPNNSRALADFSLIALKNGKLGESLEASQKIIASSTNTTMRANAWFNQGLACEYNSKSGRSSYLQYNGQYYCRDGYLYPFYKAHKIKPSQSRQQKLIDIFNNKELTNACIIPEHNIKIHFHSGIDSSKRTYSKIQRIFVLHENNRIVSGNDLAWSVTFYGIGDNVGTQERVIPERADSITLTDKTLSVFQTNKTLVQFPYELFGYQCQKDKYGAIKIRNMMHTY